MSGVVGETSALSDVPSMLPYVWLPTVLGQAALLGHLLVFRAQRRTGA